MTPEPRNSPRESHQFYRIFEVHSFETHPNTHPHLSLQFNPAPPPKEARNAARAATSCLAPGLGLDLTNTAAWTFEAVMACEFGAGTTTRAP